MGLSELSQSSQTFHVKCRQQVKDRDLQLLQCSAVLWFNQEDTSPISLAEKIFLMSDIQSCDESLMMNGSITRDESVYWTENNYRVRTNLNLLQTKITWGAEREREREEREWKRNRREKFYQIFVLLYLHHYYYVKFI